MFVSDHREKNAERFTTRDEGLRKAEQERSTFLKNEFNRHNTNLKHRERILHNISVERAQRKEMRKLRLMDAA